jgi:hypothetical protein
MPFDFILVDDTHPWKISPLNGVLLLHPAFTQDPAWYKFLMKIYTMLEYCANFFPDSLNEAQRRFSFF